MTSEAKTCQNCKREFRIEPEDFTFYEKIKVPPPTFCPECRIERRYAWRNERSLFKAKCGLCGKDIFAGYIPETPSPIYCHDCWYSDNWDPLQYGMDIDWNKPFFEQLKELMNKVPVLHLLHMSSNGSPYSNFSRDLKNGYLAYSIVVGEDIFYSKNIDNSRSIFDSLALHDSESCYGSVLCEKIYNTHFSMLDHSSVNSMFLMDSTNASDCFMSSNLRNKQYVLRNKQYDKDSYRAELAKIDTGSYEVLNELLAEFAAMRLKYPRKYAEILKSVNVVGDDLDNVKNGYYCFDAYDLENVRYCQRIVQIKDSMDVSNTANNSELMYEYANGGRNERSLKFSHGSVGALNDVQYSGNCGSSSNLFGCIGIRSKKFCILNKQYTEEEYKEILPRLIKHMNDMPYEGKNGRVYRYGEFLPIEISPFPYNTTVSQEYFPLTKEEALAKGYAWRDPDIRDLVIDIKPEDLPDHIKDAGDDITSKTIGCMHAGTCKEQCTMAFRIIPQELQLYRKLNLPLPRLCPNCRHYARFAWRNPWKLWKRKCQCAGSGSANGIYANTGTHPDHVPGEACANEFQTAYSPERKEIVYCESCYNAEVV